MLTSLTGRELDSVVQYRCPVHGCPGSMRLVAGATLPRQGGYATVYCDRCDYCVEQTVDPHTRAGT